MKYNKIMDFVVFHRVQTTLNQLCNQLLYVQIYLFK